MPIGLGVGLGVPLLIVCSMLYLAMHKRQTAKLLLPASDEILASGNGVAPMDTMCSYEVDAVRPGGAELYSDAPVAELPHNAH